MPKPLTRSETLVGRRCPPEPRHIDTLMARFVKDGAPVAAAEPSEKWLRPAFLKAKKAGWLRLRESWSLMGGRSFGIYLPTETGVAVAIGAAQKVVSAHEARRAWGRDVSAALRAGGHIGGNSPQTADEALHP